MRHAPRHSKLPAVAPLAAVGMVACTMVGAWAFWPSSPDGPGAPTADDVLASIDPRQRSVEDATLAAFDAAAFHTPLWVGVAPPVEPAAPEPPRVQPAPPLRVTLLAIARDASHAVVHDQDADRVVTLRRGDRLQGRTVSRIEPARVTLALESGQTQTLDLGYSVGRATAPLPRQTARTAVVERDTP